MLREHGRRLYFALLFTDLGIAAAAYVALAVRPQLLREGAYEPFGPVALAVLGLIVIVGWPLIHHRFGVYRSQRRERTREVVGRLFGAGTVGAVVLAAGAFVLDAPVSPAFPWIYASLVFLLFSAMRVPLFGVLHALRRSGRNFRNVLVIGAGPRAKELKDTIDRHPDWGLRIIGFVDDGGPHLPSAVPDDQIHKFVDLPRLLREEMVDEALIACPRSMLASIAPLVRECAMIGVPVTLLTDLFGDQLPPPRVGSFDSLATLTFAHVHHNEFELGLKRALDMVGAAVGLALAAPILGLAAIAIRLESPGPILFRQVRCGQSGRRFEMLKLRTMCADAESRKHDLLHLNEMDGPVFKIRSDPRVTRVGHYLRRWSIDELPQLWNVLRGDMSLVGPRPPTPDEVVQYQGGDRRRLSMRPGLTCLWQVSGRNEVCFEDWMKLDLEYIDTWSLANDLKILSRTMPEVLRGRGAS
jgi:exopolysaccharide biosynthesis polyprenyl glycosylphosphotransferase